VAVRVGFHYADIKSYFGSCVRASPHLSIRVGVPVRVALPANILLLVLVIAPHIAHASGEAHLQSEEIVERVYHTVMPTISLTLAGSAAEEVSACQDALERLQWLHPAQLLVPLGRSSVGISSHSD
jgi:hypothetical protein